MGIVVFQVDWYSSMKFYRKQLNEEKKQNKYEQQAIMNHWG